MCDATDRCADDLYDDQGQGGAYEKRRLETLQGGAYEKRRTQETFAHEKKWMKGAFDPPASFIMERRCMDMETDLPT